MCDELAMAYGTISDRLNECAEKKMDVAKKRALLEECVEREEAAIEQVATLAMSL